MAREALSFSPGEVVPADLLARLAGIDEIWRDGDCNLEVRLAAAHGRLVLGELVHTWDPGLAEARRAELASGGEWHADQKYMVPLEAIAVLLDLQLWSQERPEPAKTGQPMVCVH